MIKKNYKVKSIKKELCKEWLLHKHYLKRKTSFTFSFGLFKNLELVGIITFGKCSTINNEKIFVWRKIYALGL